MFKFGEYPIYVVYSLNRQKAVDPMWSEYSALERRALASAAEGLLSFNMDRFFRQLAVAGQNEKLVYATWDWQLIEDLDSKHSQEIFRYEESIRRLLKNIAATRVGAVLLRHIGKNPTNAKIWIIPANWDGPTAKTLNLTETEGGGIRIHFNPAAFGNDAEATLVHELVHAKRYAWKQMMSQPFEDRDAKQEFRNSSEEFLATQVENIHISSRKLSSLFSSYNGAPRTKQEMYRFFGERPDFPIALKHFVDKDLMVKEMAGLKNPEYNPFRDVEQLRKAAGIDPQFMRSFWK